MCYPAKGCGCSRRPGYEINTGYLWDAACGQVFRFGIMASSWIPRAILQPISPFRYCAIRSPASPSGLSLHVSLNPFTDPYFRGFDNSLPDYWRYGNGRETSTPTIRGLPNAGRALEDLPALTLIRLMHDHTGNYTTAIDGVSSRIPEIADNDYAVGLLMQKISQSQFANNTLIFVIEDDSQDGGDHVDSHRTIAFVVGAYVKRGAVVSTQYTTLNFLRTIEEVLGMPEKPAAGSAAHDEPERRSGKTHGGYFQHDPEPLDFYRRSFGDALQYLASTAAETIRHDCAEAGARCEVLGPGYQGNRFH